jgi:hypothetical protein
MTKTTPPVATSATPVAGPAAETTPTNSPPSLTKPSASLDLLPIIAAIISVGSIMGFSMGRLHQWARLEVYGLDWQLFSNSLQDTVLMGFILHYLAMGLFLLACMLISLVITVFVIKDVDKDIHKKGQFEPSALQLARRGYPLVLAIQKLALTNLYIGYIALISFIYIVIGSYVYVDVAEDTKAEIVALRSKNAAAFANKLSNFAEITLKDNEDNEDNEDNAPTLRGLVIQMNDKFLAIHDGKHMRILRLEAEVQSYKKITADEAFADPPSIATKPASQ